MHLYRLAGLTAGAFIGLGLVAAPAAQARPHVYPLSIEVLSVAPTKAKIRVTCPIDPPARLYLSGTIAGVPTQLGTTEPFNCTERPQQFQLTLTNALPRGTVITDATVTFSGDSGEINGFYDTLVVR